jgi:small-conductance mechanosensitive channel
VIASVAGWLAVSVGGFYSPGDRIQLGGITGDVIDIGILRTTVMECGRGSRVINTTALSCASPTVSSSRSRCSIIQAIFPFLWDEIMVPIKYGSDYRMARELIERIAEEVVADYARTALRARQSSVKSAVGAHRQLLLKSVTPWNSPTRF